MSGHLPTEVVDLTDDEPSVAPVDSIAGAMEIPSADGLPAIPPLPALNDVRVVQPTMSEQAPGKPRHLK